MMMAFIKGILPTWISTSCDIVLIYIHSKMPPTDEETGLRRIK